VKPHPLGRAAKLGAVICGALIATVAWSSYRNPAMGLLLEAIRFCG